MIGDLAEVLEGYLVAVYLRVGVLGVGHDGGAGLHRLGLDRRLRHAVGDDSAS